jgi:hypothetical protein
MQWQAVVMDLELNRRWTVCWLAEQLLAFQEGLRYVKLTAPWLRVDWHLW